MVTRLEAEPPFSVAVIVACPCAFAVTGSSAKSAPAGTFTCAGTDATEGLAELNETAVAAFGAQGMVGVGVRW